MDWRGITFDWAKARAFLVTAEEGTLTAAARALGLTQPTLGRQIEGLEAELGVALFERVGRGLVLTPAGEALLPQARAMGEAARGLSFAAADRRETVDGAISLTCSEIYATSLLAPIVADLRRAHPGITVAIRASNDTLDLRLREADIAIRSYRPTEEGLVARKIGEDRGRFYATPALLARLGNPTRIEDLSRAPFIAFGPDSVAEMIGLMERMGLRLGPGNFPIEAGDHHVHWALCREGAGIGIVPDRVGEADPAVVRVLPAAPPMEFPIWLATHRDLKTARRVRVVFDFLAEALARA